MLQATREAGKNALLGFRVNDPRDRLTPQWRTRFKLDHPEYLLGGGYLPSSLANSYVGERLLWVRVPADPSICH